MPGKGLVKSGTKKGAQFKTPACPRIDVNDPPHYFKNEFGYGVPVYWMGSYVDLEMEEIEIEVSRRHGPTIAYMRSLRREPPSPPTGVPELHGEEGQEAMRRETLSPAARSGLGDAGVCPEGREEGRQRQR